MSTPKSDISVTIKNVLDNTEYTIDSDVNGLASFNVPAGIYEVSIIDPTYIFKTPDSENVIIDIDGARTPTNIPYIINVDNTVDSMAIMIITSNGIDRVRLIREYGVTPGPPNTYYYTLTAQLLTPATIHDVIVNILSYIEGAEPPPTGPTFFPILTIPAGSINSNTETKLDYSSTISEKVLKVKLNDVSSPYTVEVIVNDITLDLLTYITFA